jgi:nucleotide-binding universal stress UspA family protein
MNAHYVRRAATISAPIVEAARTAVTVAQTRILSLLKQETDSEGEMKLESHQEQLFKRILVAVDGSDNAGRAARVAVTLAKKFGVELIVSHVIPTPSHMLAQPSMGTSGVALRNYFAMARDDAKKLVDEVVRRAEADGVKATGVVRENVFSVVEAIVKLAEEKNVDLIVIGTRGLTGFRKLLIGSVSSGVISHAHCSLLLVR